MFVSYLESLRYVGLMWPIVFLRFFMSVQYFSMGMELLKAGYLEHPYLSEQLRLKMESVGAINGYLSLWANIVQEFWLLGSYILILSYFVIAASYAVGYLVRPVALAASLISLHMYWLIEAQGEKMQLMAFAIHLTLALVGAGRCLGLDYYFYKSRRGLIW